MRPKRETFADAAFERYRKAIGRKQFLTPIDTVLPWQKFMALIEPMHPGDKGTGRPSVFQEPMARNNDSDPTEIEGEQKSVSQNHYD